MSNVQERAARRQAMREDVLLALYELGQGNSLCLIPGSALRAQVPSLTQEDVAAAISSLNSDDYAAWEPTRDQFVLTPEGVQEANHILSRSRANRPSSEQHFHAPVGNVQNGNRNAAHVWQGPVEPNKNQRANAQPAPTQPDPPPARKTTAPGQTAKTTPARDSLPPQTKRLLAQMHQIVLRLPESGRESVGDLLDAVEAEAGGARVRPSVVVALLEGMRREGPGLYAHATVILASFPKEPDQR